MHWKFGDVTMTKLIIETYWKAWQRNIFFPLPSRRFHSDKRKIKSYHLKLSAQQWLKHDNRNVNRFFWTMTRCGRRVFLFKQYKSVGPLRPSDKEISRWMIHLVSTRQLVGQNTEKSTQYFPYGPWTHWHLTTNCMRESAFPIIMII